MPSGKAVFTSCEASRSCAFSFARHGRITVNSATSAVASRIKPAANPAILRRSGKRRIGASSIGRLGGFWQVFELTCSAVFVNLRRPMAKPSSHRPQGPGPLRSGRRGADRAARAQYLLGLFAYHRDAPLVARSLAVSLEALNEELEALGIRRKAYRVARGTDAQMPLAAAIAGPSGPPVRRRPRSAPAAPRSAAPPLAARAHRAGAPPPRRAARTRDPGGSGPRSRGARRRDLEQPAGKAGRERTVREEAAADAGRCPPAAEAVAPKLRSRRAHLRIRLRELRPHRGTPAEGDRSASGSMPGVRGQDGEDHEPQLVPAEGRRLVQGPVQLRQQIRGGRDQQTRERRPCRRDPIPLYGRLPSQPRPEQTRQKLKNLIRSSPPLLLPAWRGR